MLFRSFDKELIKRDNPPVGSYNLPEVRSKKSIVFNPASKTKEPKRAVSVGPGSYEIKPTIGRKQNEFSRLKNSGRAFMTRGKKEETFRIDKGAISFETINNEKPEWLK